MPNLSCYPLESKREAENAYSPIEHLGRTCSLSDWRNVNMVMLQTAFDCSSEASQRYFIMAGFIASAERWAEFDVEWRKRLAEDGLPYFHMQPFSQSFHHAKKPFDSTWVGDGKRRERLLGDLLDIIRSHAWYKLACILPEESLLMFSDVAREHFVPTRIATAGRLMWADVEVWRRREGFRNQAEMIFEDGDHEKGTLMKAMREITGQSPIFREKKDKPEEGIVGFTPLQAADILAYEVQKLTTQDGRSLDEIPFRFPYGQLERVPGDIRMLRADGTKLMDEFLRVTHYFNVNPLRGTVQ